MNRGRTIKLVAAVIVAATLSGPPVRGGTPGHQQRGLGQLMVMSRPTGSAAR